MSMIRTTAVLAGLLFAIPATSALAQTATAPKPATAKAAQAAKPAAKSAAPAAKSTTAAVHATRGVVKSVDDKSLVISRQNGKEKDMTFVLNASTQHKGTAAVGATVQVRYRAEGSENVATAVTVQEKKK